MYDKGKVANEAKVSKLMAIFNTLDNAEMDMVIQFTEALKKKAKKTSKGKKSTNGENRA